MSQRLKDKIYNSQRMDKAVAKLMDMVTHLHERELESVDLRLKQQIVVTYVIAFIVILLMLTLYVVWRQKKRQMDSYRLLIEKEEKIADREKENRQLKEIVEQEAKATEDDQDKKHGDLSGRIAGRSTTRSFSSRPTSRSTC